MKSWKCSIYSSSVLWRQNASGVDFCVGTIFFLISMPNKHLCEIGCFYLRCKCLAHFRPYDMTLIKCLAHFRPNDMTLIKSLRIRCNFTRHCLQQPLAQTNWKPCLGGWEFLISSRQRLLQPFLRKVASCTDALTCTNIKKYWKNITDKNYHRHFINQNEYFYKMGDRIYNVIGHQIWRRYLFIEDLNVPSA